MSKTKIKKILNFLITHLYWKNKIPFEIIFTDDFYFQNIIKRFKYFLFYHKNIYKLIITPIIIKYKTKLSSDKSTNKLIRNYLTVPHTQQNEKTILCILRLIYELEVEDYLVFQNILELAIHTDNLINKYWLVQNIETFAFWRTLKLPQNYYSLRKQLIKDICTNIIKSPPQLNNIKNKKKQLCIVTYLLGDSLKNSVQRILNMLTNNIDSSFFDISVVCLDSFFCKKDNVINITGWKNSTKIKLKSKALIKDSKIYYCNSQNIYKKLESSLDIIYKINPDLIIDISDEYSITSYFYSKDFTTLYIPLRGRVTSSYCTIYKTSDFKETIKQNKYFDNVLSNTKLVEWCFPEYIMKSDVQYTRKKFGLSENLFILISAGILPQNDIDFFTTLIHILDLNENFQWIIVGSSIPTFITTKYSKYFEEKKIIDWGYEKNLDSLYKICNVFINPNKTGGSGTIAIAAQQKLPIIISTFPCDAMRWIDKKYCIQNGYEGFALEILKLYQDKNYYNLQSEAFYDMVSKINNSKSKWTTFNQILKDSIK